VDAVYQFGLETIAWLQATLPQLASFFAVISDLGRFEFYLALIPLIYWCIHKRLGKELAYVLAIANMVTNITKHALRAPRPYWLEEELGLSNDPLYGVPSGHVHSATVAYLYLASQIKRRLVWVLAGLIIFLMALSRIYLGMHFIHDTAAAFMIGVFILAGLYVWRGTFHRPFQNRILGQRLLLALLVPVLFLALYVGVMLLLGEPAQNTEWAAFTDLAEFAMREEVTTAAGILLGLGVGFILEATRVHFLVDGTVLKRTFRYLFGMIVTLAIWQGLGSVFPDEPQWLALPLRFLRYLLAGLWVSYYGPLVFVRLRLADASPEPDVSLTISQGGIMDR
jgi:membrane-associated phospholipid phosphatase